MSSRRAILVVGIVVVVVGATAAGTLALGDAAAGWSMDSTTAAPREGGRLPPDEYVRLHRAALSPDRPEWEAAVKRLADGGDHFSAHLLSKLKLADLTAAGAERARDRALSRLAKRLEPETAESVRSTLRERFERAALADLNCDRLEGLLVSWTLQSVRRHLADPGMVAALAEIAASYEPAQPVTTAFSSPRERVRRYAQGLVDQAAKSERPHATTP